MTDQVSESARKSTGSEKVMRRFDAVEEVARTAVFLSEDAIFCTAIPLSVDGGWTL